MEEMDTDFDNLINVISDICRDMVRKMGNPYVMGSEYCDQRQVKDENSPCRDCDFTNGCAMFSSIFAAYSFAMHEPTEQGARELLQKDWDRIKNFKSPEDYGRYQLEMTTAMSFCGHLPIYDRINVLQKICDDIEPPKIDPDL